MVEVYGIPKDVHYCWGCQETIKLLDSLDIEYKFYAVVEKVDSELGFDYNRPRIKELAERLNCHKMSFVYPQIFVDGHYIGGYKEIRSLYD